MGLKDNEDRERIADGSSAGGPPGKTRAGRGKKRAFTGFGVLMLFVLAASLVFYFNFKTVEVRGRSMLPTFKDKDRVLVSKAYWLVGPLRKRDIVVVRDEGPSSYFIKRIAYMAGETVDWKYLPDNVPMANGKFVVPEGTVFVLGDNLPESEDSRKLGPIPLDQLLGKVVVWP